MVDTTAGKPKLTTLQALATFLERRTICMLGLGFAAGLPNLLIADTLSAWLFEDGITLANIAFFSLATLFYSLKFIWAPLVDRTTIPLLTKWLGHRRSWMLVAQLLVMLGLWLIAGSSPAENLGLVAVFAAFVGFSGATQDIVIDAWRIEVAPTDRQGVMATAYQWGYRIAIIVAGAAPLFLAKRYGWDFSYAAMAALMGIGLLSVFFAPREIKHVIRPIPVGDVPSRPAFEVIEWLLRLALIVIIALFIGSGLTGKIDILAGILRQFGLSKEGSDGLIAAWGARPLGVYLQIAAVFSGLGALVLACWPLPFVRTRPGAYLAGSFGHPLRDFFSRFHGLAALILALICFYRLADFVLVGMNPFYQGLGFDLDEIAEVRKIFGVAASMTGVFIGGLSVVRLGLIRTMVIGAFASPLSNLVFAWLAVQGHDMPALFVTIGVDNFAGGYAGTALIAYMSSLTNVGFTATQYALFSSLYALPGKLLASQTGRIIEGSARWADAGGATAAFKPWFAHLPPETLLKGAQTAGVTNTALGAGYITFFLYSTVIGVFAVVLAFIVAPRHRRVLEAAEEAKITESENRET